MLDDLRNWERRVYSQSGEDGVIERIFSEIGASSRFFVEFGAKDGFNLSNTALLRIHRGWDGLLIDPRGLPGSTVVREMVTAENINEVFSRHGVPREFDLLSIDIDSNEYWVWKALRDHTPRLVVIEYNIFLDPHDTEVVPYDPERSWDGTNYHGASLSALRKLGEEKGYALIHTDSYAPNAFFALRSALPSDYVEPSFGEVAVWAGLPEPPELHDRPWIRV
ncbi:MAG: hypothetical protein GY725_09390 [bacterium]|nr:hypothetical protein [bacterium]